MANLGVAGTANHMQPGVLDDLLHGAANRVTASKSEESLVNRAEIAKHRISVGNRDALEWVGQEVVRMSKAISTLDTKSTSAELSSSGCTIVPIRPSSQGLITTT